MLADDGAAFGAALSGSGDNDPRLIEHPQSATATNRIGVDAHQPKREAPEWEEETGMVIDAEHSRGLRGHC
jgi:hypothetical protein